MSFRAGGMQLVERALKKLKAELGERMQGVVLDLRNNPGGLLDQSIKVADLFLERGEIVSTRGRRSEDAQRFNAKAGDEAGGLPLVVLINGGSASASEIVAGALQDHRRGIVMGTHSFGKGSVQTIIPLSGRGAIRLTTAHYYTPSGRSIQAKGIEPDIQVRQAARQAADPDDRGRERDLPNALRNPDEDGKDGAPAPEADGADDEAAARPEDYQLARAVDLLRGLALHEARPAR